MNRKLFRLTTLVVTVLVALLALVAIIPASADRPDRPRDFWVWTGTTTACGSEFEWVQEVSLQGVAWCEPSFCDFYFHTKETDTFTNPDNGRTLVLKGSAFTKVTPVNEGDLIEVSGQGLMGTIPGVGPVFGSPGHHIFLETCTAEGECTQEPVFDSGPTFDDIEAICTYMLGE